MNQQEEKLDFENEVQEFIKEQLVKSVEVVSKSEIRAHLKLVTLEDIEILIECSTQKGLKILELKGAELKQSGYDTFEQILTTYSPKYSQKFAEKLSNRLSDLAQ